MDGEPRPRERGRRAGRGWRQQPPYVLGGAALSGLRAEWTDGVLTVAGEPLAEFAVVPVGALGLGSDLVPMAGSWRIDEGEARFTPRFAAPPGAEFAVVTRTPAGWNELARATVPSSGLAPTTSVESIEPDVDEVPANLLRFAVTFSVPMDDGSAAGRIHLLDEHGDALDGTILDDPELWDRERRRLTVLLEPGRIKRGLQPNVQAGPPLREGSVVTIVVGSGIRDFAGLSLIAEARRTYRVGPPLRSRVDPALWTVRWPRGDGDLVDIRFDRPMDAASVQRFIRVTEGGREIRVDTRLEDVAGNSVRRVFDRDLDDPRDDGIDAGEIVLTP